MHNDVVSHPADVEIKILHIWFSNLTSSFAGKDKRDNGECFLGQHHGIHEK